MLQFISSNQRMKVTNSSWSPKWCNRDSLNIWFECQSQLRNSSQHSLLPALTMTYMCCLCSSEKMSVLGRKQQICCTNEHLEQWNKYWCLLFYILAAKAQFRLCKLHQSSCPLISIKKLKWACKCKSPCKSPCPGFTYRLILHSKLHEPVLERAWQILKV